MRKEQEINRIANGIWKKKITLSADILDIDVIANVFPGILDLTLRQALDMIHREVYCIFQWNDKMNKDGFFEDWEEISECEWSAIKKKVSQTAKNPRRNIRRKRQNTRKK